MTSRVTGPGRAAVSGCTLKGKGSASSITGPTSARSISCTAAALDSLSLVSSLCSTGLKSMRPVRRATGPCQASVGLCNGREAAAPGRSGQVSSLTGRMAIRGAGSRKLVLIICSTA